MKTKITETWIKKYQLPEGVKRVSAWDTELAGFGVIVGRRFRTFIVSRRVKGNSAREMHTIGHHGQPGADGSIWTVARARDAATILVGQMKAGIEPETPKRASASGPTWRDALELHVANMKKKKRSGRSIHSIETEVPRLLGDWLDRPIVDLGGAELEALCSDIMSRTTARAGAVNPPGAALTKRFVAQLSACWNAADKLHDLPGKNPATRVTTHALDPRTERISDAEFPDWLATVQTLSPVRRDLQLLALFTGLRSESARTLQWDDVDFGRKLLHVRIAKGDKPYTIPIADSVIAILKRRKKENPAQCAVLGLPDDDGWIFPTRTRARPWAVIHLAESKEYRTENGERAKLLPGLHTLRKTFNSVAIEIGIPKESRERLMNHNGQGVNVRHYGFPQNWPALALEAGKIERALLQRLGVRRGAI